MTLLGRRPQATATGDDGALRDYAHRVTRLTDQLLTDLLGLMAGDESVEFSVVTAGGERRPYLRADVAEEVRRFFEPYWRGDFRRKPAAVTPYKLEVRPGQASIQFRDTTSKRDRFGMPGADPEGRSREWEVHVDFNAELTEIGRAHV